MAYIAPSIDFWDYVPNENYIIKLKDIELTEEKYKTYKCIKPMVVPVCDDYGSETGNQMILDVDSLWELSEEANFIGGEAHLDNPDTLEWIEISNEDLDEYFVLVE